MTKRDILFRESPIKSGIGDYMYDRARSDAYPLPDLSYKDETAPELDYDRLGYEKEKSAVAKGMGAALTVMGGISTLTGNIAGGPLASLGGLKLTLRNTEGSPRGYNVFDYGKDALFSWLNMRDDTNLRSEQGKIVYEIDPELERYSLEKDYLNKMLDAEAALDIYRSSSTPENDAEYRRLKAEVDQLTPAYMESIQERFGNPSIAGAFGNEQGKMLQYLNQPTQKRLEDVENQLASLDAQKQEQFDKVNELRVDIWDRELGNNWILNHKISDFYKDKEEDTKFGFFNTDAWMFKVPGTLGSSFASVEAQAVGIAGAYVANLARTAALQYATASTLTPQVALGGQILAHGMAIAGTAATIGGTLYARERETFAELFENYSQKVRAYAERSGLDLGALIEEGKKSLEGVANPSLLTDDEVLDLMIASQIPTSNEAFNKIRKDAREGLDHLYNQNMALSVSDIGQTALAIPFVGKLMSAAVGGGAKALQLGKAATVFNKGLDNVIEYGTKIAPSMAAIAKNPNTKAFGKYIGKNVIGRTLLTSVAEAYEEGNQYIGGQRFIDNMYEGRSSNVMHGIWDNMTSIYEASKAVLGIGESAFADDGELFQNMIAGGMIGGLMTLPMNAPVQVRNFTKQVQANQYVRSLTAEQLKEKENFAKAKIYANGTALGRQEQIINALKWLKDDMAKQVPHKSYNITEQDVEEEITRAQRVMDIANSKFINSVSGALGIEKGSKKFTDLVAMSNYSIEQFEKERAINNDLVTAYNNLFTTEHFNNIGESLTENPEVAGVIAALSKYNMEKYAVSDLIETLKSNKKNAEDFNARFGTKLDTKKIDSYLRKLEDLAIAHAEVGTRIERQLKDADANFSIQDIESYASPYGTLMDPALAYQKMVLSQISLGEAYEMASLFNGIAHPLQGYRYDATTGRVLEVRTETPYNNLKKRQKLVANDQIKDYLDRYAKVEETTRNMETVLADTQAEEAPEIKTVTDKYETPVTTETEEDILPPEEPVEPTKRVMVNGVWQEVPESQTTTARIFVNGEWREIDVPKPKVVDDNSINDVQRSNSLEDLIKRSTIVEDTSAAVVAPEEPVTTLEDPVEAGEAPEDIPDILPRTETDALSEEQYQIANEMEKLSESNSGEINAGITDGSLSDTVIMGMGNNSKYGKTSHTMFYNPESTMPMEEGFRPGKELSDLLATPGKLAELDFEFTVQNFYGTYNAQDESTWDNATVGIIITDPATGYKYMAAMKHPNTARSLHAVTNTRTAEDMETDIKRLKEFRDKVISLHIQAQQAGSRVVPTKTFISNGLFNQNRTEDGRVINRPISEVKGFEFPDDVYAIDQERVKIGIGGGIRAYEEIFDKEGRVLGGKGRSGKIYIYPKNTPSGETVNIQLNERQFKEDPEIVDLIFELLVKYGGNEVDPVYRVHEGRQYTTGFTPKSLLRVLINNGPRTLLDDESRARVPFLIPKQLNFNYQTQQIQLGDTFYDRNTLLNDPQMEAEFKAKLSEMHWSMDKDWLWDKVGHAVPLEGWFTQTGLDKLIIIPGKLEFTMQEAGLEYNEDGIAVPDYDHSGGISWVAWYAKNNVLRSDLKDQLFTAPFLYAEDVIVEDTKTSQAEQTQMAPVDNSLSALLSRSTVMEADEINAQTKTNDAVSDLKELLTDKVVLIGNLANRPPVEYRIADVELRNPRNQFVNSVPYVKGYRIDVEDVSGDWFKYDSINFDTEIGKEVRNIVSKYDSDNSVDSPDLDNFLGIGRPTYYQNKTTPINKEKSSKWLRDNLNMDPIWTSKVIEMGISGVKVMGLTRNDSIILWEGAERGTEYHEAFHRVSVLLLNDTERTNIYNSYRKQNDLQKVPDTLIEERLAEDFRDWMLSRTRRISYQIRKFFNKILSWIGGTRLMSDTSIQDLYSKINSGYFKDVEVSTENIDRYKALYEDGVPFTVGTSANPVKFKHIPTLYNYYRILDSLQAMLFFTNAVRSVSDINQLNVGKLKGFLQGSLRSNKFTTQQKLALAEVLENFEIAFWPDMKLSLENLGIRAIERERDAYQSEVDAGNVPSGEIQWSDKASFEVSKKENALFTVKTFISQITDTVAVYVEDANGRREVKNKALLDPITGLPAFVDFDTSWNRMLNSLYDVEFYSNGNGKTLLDTVGKLANDIPFFRTLYNKLTNDPLITEELKTQLLQTIKSHKHNMFYVSYTDYLAEDGETTRVGFRIGDSNTLRAGKMYPMLWSGTFYNHSGIVKRNNDGVSIDKTRLRSVIDRFNKLVSDVDTAVKNRALSPDALVQKKKDFLQILSDIGIVVDMATLDTAMTNIREVSDANSFKEFSNLLGNKRTRSVNNLINKTLSPLLQDKAPTYIGKNGKEQAKTLDKIFTYDSFITALAEAYSFIHPRPEEMSVLGAEGNLLYPIAENNYMSDMIRWLNQEAPANKRFNETVTKLDQVTYNRGSMMLRHLKGKGKLQLNTFANFTEESVGDRGRDYLSISPLEDYISKMTLVANDHIILPTMADKKTYFTITGVKLFHQPLTLTKDGNLNVLRLGTETLNQYLQYALDEWNTIREYYSENYQKLLRERPEKQVKNYHSKNKGGRFRYFTGVWLNVNGVQEFTSFNDLLDKFEKEGNIQEAINIIETEFFGKDTWFKLNAVNENLKRIIYNEISTARSLGLIDVETRPDNRVPIMKNRLLDEMELERRAIPYVNSAEPELQNNAETYAILDMLADYAVNSMISIMEFEKIFAKDPAYYKNVDDKIKRLGEVLSTGTNLRIDWEAGSDMIGRTDYTSAEINDVMASSPQFAELEKLFETAYFNQYVEENNNPDLYEMFSKIAKEKARADARGYGDGSIDVTDATAIISPRMYRDIMRMLGEWGPDIEEAYNIMESGTEWLSNPTLYAKAMKSLIKPLKMMYFGDNFDPELHLDIPIYDKMALFPLFKVIATGDNLELYNRMTGQGKYQNATPIDMVKVSSAVKVGTRATSDFYNGDGNVDDLNNMTLYKQEFKHLRRQLTTDPHTQERQLLGTQVAKGALSNIVHGRTYGNEAAGMKKMLGSQIRQEVFGAMNALSNIGMVDFLNQVGRFENGEFIGDINKLSKLLIDDAKQTGLPYDILEGLQVVNDEFRIPISAMSSSNWIESRFISLINKNTVDINMPGGAYIQMSAFGFKSITPVSDTALNDGDQLRFRNEDGSMDAMISMNMLKHIIPQNFRKDHATMRQWLLDHNIIGKNAKPMAMGYRIPTQGLSSISALKIVDVLPEVIGDTVILPEEFTKLTGSDFDIDKLYIARYNYDNEGNRIEFDDTPKSEANWNAVSDDLRAKGFDEDYITKEYINWTAKNQGKTKWEANSREANENRLLDMYMTVLTDNSNVNETRATLDAVTDYLKGTVLKNVDGNIETDLDIPYADLSPAFQLSKKYEYTGGKNGIAPFALNNVHHVLTQLMNLTFKPHKQLQKLGLMRLDGIYSNDANKTRILDWLSALINAHVDVAKDPYIIRLNVVQWTYNMTNLMLRTGVGENTFYFMPQQILKDMAQKVANTTGRYGVDTSKSATQLEQDAVDAVYNEYWDRAMQLANEEQQDKLRDVEMRNEDGSPVVDNQDTIWDKEFLLEQLRKGREGNLDFDWYYNQLRIFQTYKQLEPYAKGLSELVHTTQIDTKKFGNNFMLQKQFLYRVKRNILDNKVFDPQDLKDFYQKTFLDTKLRNSVMLGMDLFSDKIIRANDQFISFHNAMLSLMGQIDTKNDRVINQVSNAIEGNIKSQFFANYVRDNNISVRDYFYGENSLAYRLMDLKSEIISGVYPDLVDDAGHIKNELLNYIDGRPGNVTFDGYNIPDFITTNTMQDNDRYLQDKLKRYWQELLDHEDAKIRKFAEDLALFAFITSADNYTMNGIFQLVPLSYREKLGYTKYIQDTINEMKDGLSDVNMDDVFKNNWFNGAIVPDVKFSRRYFAFGEMQQDDLDHIMSVDTIPGEDRRYPLVIWNKRATSIGVNANNQPLFRPYVKYNLDKTKNPATTILYKYVGNSMVDGKTIPVYTAVSKKGLNSDGIVVTEYNGIEKSMFDFNNLPNGRRDIRLTSDPKDIDNLFYTASFNNEYVEARMRKMVDGTVFIDDFNLADAANAYTYDYIMNNDISLVLNAVTAVSEQTSEEIVAENKTVLPEETTMHSGGAYGADTVWENAATKYGVKTNAWSFEGHTGVISPNAIVLTKEQLAEADGHLAKANETLERKWPTSQEYKSNLLRRNWYQVKDSDAVFAVSTLDNGIVTGGTAWAVQMALDTGKPVFLYEQNQKQWLVNNGDGWKQTDTPTLTKNFAGIGSRQVNEAGEAAIEAVFEKTFGNQTNNNIRRTYTGHITTLPSNGIFVFGSNTQGRHGKGAALTAKNSFGAVYGNPSGPQGKSYAIITKDLTVPVAKQAKSINEDDIKHSIGKLYDYARSNPNLDFYIAYSGTGSNLNGYSNQDMANMFGAFPIPSNIVFEESFEKLLPNTVNNITETVTIDPVRSDDTNTETTIGDNAEVNDATVYFDNNTVGLEPLSNTYSSTFVFEDMNYESVSEAFRAIIAADPIRITDKEQLMYEIVRQKFLQNPGAQQVLLGTGNKELVYNTSNRSLFRTNDTYWGNGYEGNGKNTLGRILAQLRNELTIANNEQMSMSDNTLAQDDYNSEIKTRCQNK